MDDLFSAMLTETSHCWPSLEVSSRILTRQVENDARVWRAEERFPAHGAQCRNIDLWSPFEKITVWLAVCTSLIDFDSALQERRIDHFNRCKPIVWQAE